MKPTLNAEDAGGPIAELATIRELWSELSQREERAVRKGRNMGLSWAEIGTLLGVTKQTVHRKYRNIG